MSELNPERSEVAKESSRGVPTKMLSWTDSVNFVRSAGNFLERSYTKGRWAIVACLLLVMLGQGLRVRYQVYTKHLADHDVSSDLAGFVRLASGSEPIRDTDVPRSRFFTGWREPGAIHLIRAVNFFVKDYERAWRLITFWSSSLLFLGVCAYAYHFFGPLPAVIVAWLWANIEVIVRLSGSGYREDLVALFVLATWLCLLKQRWKSFAVLTIVGSYFRLGHLNTALFGFCALALLGYVPLAQSWARDRSLIRTLGRQAFYPAIILACVAPLLIYYKLTWGSFFYPLDLILYDSSYYLHNRTWTVAVTGGFYNPDSLVPDDFSFWQSFNSVSDFIVKILTGFRYVFWTSVRYHFLPKGVAFSALYLAGAGLALWNRKTRRHVALGLAYGLQLVPIAWIEGVMHYRFLVILQLYTTLFVGHALAEAARTALPGVVSDLPEDAIEPLSPTDPVKEQ